MEEPEEHYPERLGDALKPIEGQRKEGTDEPPAILRQLDIFGTDPEWLWHFEAPFRDPADAEPAPEAKERK
jgi:hypothetical protein